MLKRQGAWVELHTVLSRTVHECISYFWLVYMWVQMRCNSDTFICTYVHTVHSNTIHMYIQCPQYLYRTYVSYVHTSTYCGGGVCMYIHCVPSHEQQTLQMNCSNIKLSIILTVIIINIYILSFKKYVCTYCIFVFRVVSMYSMYVCTSFPRPVFQSGAASFCVCFFCC